MKLIGIGDLFIPSKYILDGFGPWTQQYGVDVSAIDWRQRNIDELQKINLAAEQGGSEAVEVEDAVIDAVSDADILITEFCPINKKVIDRCPHLKAIGVLRAGIENINLDYAAEKGILVYNTPGRNADAVADFTVGGILAECRNIARGCAVVKQGGWKSPYPNRHYVPDLPGKTAGLIGFGNIGQKVAKRLYGFDMKLLAFDPFFRGEPPYGVELVTLEELLSRSDFICMHARAMPDTRHMLGKKEFALVKKGAYFINTARSLMVDEQALYEALTNGTLAGAFLDVFDTEPTGADYPLVKLDNVTVTPHMAGGSTDAFLNSPKLLASFMAPLFSGEPGRCLLDPAQYPAAAENFRRK